MATSLTLRVLEVNARTYRRIWRGSVITTFLNPILFLAAMGLGLGTLVDSGTGSESLETASYLKYLAPGLLAATAMQTGAGDSTYPVMAGIKWIRTYHAALSTPIDVTALTMGHLGWVAIRLTFVSLVYAVITMLFGAVALGWGLLSVAPAVLTGLAFAAPVTAYTATLERETGLSSLFRFGIVPLFLFSGTFFPIEQLPDLLEPIAYITPLWHGVELTRGIALQAGTTLAPWVHVAFLVAVVVFSAGLAVRNLRRRMVV